MDFGMNDFGGFGGGFLNNSSMADGFAENSTEGSRVRLPRDKQSLLPVTIKQIHQAQQDHADSGIRIDNQEVHNVTIVGCVNHSQDNATYFSMVLDDGTGQIECRIFIDSTNATETAHAIQKRATVSRESPGVYVRVFGSVRVLGSRRLVNCLDYQIITDMNEVTFHMLECIYIHNFHTKGPVPGEIKQMVGAPIAPVKQDFNSIARTPISATSNEDGLTPCQKSVLDIFINNSRDEIGLHKRRVIEALSNQFSAFDIQSSINFLSNEGRLFSTIDEDTFKYTGNL